MVGVVGAQYWDIDKNPKSSHLQFSPSKLGIGKIIIDINFFIYIGNPFLSNGPWTFLG